MIVLTQMEYVFFTQKTQNHGKRKATRNILLIIPKILREIIP